MPPKTRITKEMILDAAFEIVRREGADSLSVRNISDKLSCSTQPIMYNFPTADDIKRAVYKKADEFHMQYTMDIKGGYGNPLLKMGALYVKFAAEEPHLFKFLFQSEHFLHQNIEELLEDEEMQPVLKMIAAAMSSDMASAKELFLTRYFMIHGLASLISNNSMEYNEKRVSELILEMFRN